MYKHFIFSILLLSTTFNTQAQVNDKSANKAVLNIFTYDGNGKLLQTGTAFYCDAESNGITSYDLLKGAYKAEIIDTKGKKYDVLRILGANATTNLAKFSTNAPRTKLFFNLYTDSVTTNTITRLVQYKSGKNKETINAAITGIEPFNPYHYYQISIANYKSNFNCPLINEKGNLVAIVQQNVKKDAKTACAIDARFIKELSISSTSSLDSDLKAIFIPKALPAHREDALTYLYMFPEADSLNNRIALDDFVHTYPQIADGYMNRASFLTRHNQYEDAEKDFNTAIEKATSDTTGLSLDYVHYNISDLMYKTILSQSDSVYIVGNWTLTRAADEAEKAYSLNKNTLYLLQIGKIAFAQKHYEQAYQTLKKVCEDNKFATPENYFLAARSLELTGKDSTEVISLLDRSIASLSSPVEISSAAYYLERAKRLIDAKRYREAAFDYFEYEKIIGPKNLTADFYYLRQQVEMNARMYQQALNDIRTAISISDNDVFYRIEEAYILLRVGEFDAAIAAAQSIMETDADNTDCLKILGICYGTKGKKQDALKYLTLAKQLGDESVSQLIQEYEKE